MKQLVSAQREMCSASVLPGYTGNSQCRRLTDSNRTSAHSSAAQTRLCSACDMHGQSSCESHIDSHGLRSERMHRMMYRMIGTRAVVVFSVGLSAAVETQSNTRSTGQTLSTTPDKHERVRVINEWRTVRECDQSV